MVYTSKSVTLASHQIKPLDESLAEWMLGCWVTDFKKTSVFTLVSLSMALFGTMIYCRFVVSSDRSPTPGEFGSEMSMCWLLSDERSAAVQEMAHEARASIR